MGVTTLKKFFKLTMLRPYRNNMVDNKFPFKPNEKIFDTVISVKSNDYLLAIKIIKKHFRTLGYEAAASVGSTSDDGKLRAITNILARNPHTNIEYACVATFPRRRNISSKGLIERADKLLQYWKLVAIFLCFRKGTGNFPIMSKRIIEADNQRKKHKISIFSIDLKTGEVKGISRWRNNTEQSKPKEKEKE